MTIINSIIRSLYFILLPDILAYYESEEGQREFAEWKRQREEGQAKNKPREKS